MSFRKSAAVTDLEDKYGGIGDQNLPTCSFEIVSDKFSQIIAVYEIAL